MRAPHSGSVFLCPSAALREGGLAVPFEVWYAGERCRAFAVRFQGQVQAYLNRCTHLPMALDWLPNQVFDASGEWLLCATHGAFYAPDSGACAGGPCRGALVKIALSEDQGAVHWHTSQDLLPVEL